MKRFATVHVNFDGVTNLKIREAKDKHLAARAALVQAAIEDGWFDDEADAQIPHTLDEIREYCFECDTSLDVVEIPELP